MDRTSLSRTPHPDISQAQEESPVTVSGRDEFRRADFLMVDAVHDDLSFEAAQSTINHWDKLLSDFAPFVNKSLRYQTQASRTKSDLPINLYRRLLRSFRNSCERYELLPSWCETQEYPILESVHPVGRGGHADVFRGVLKSGPGKHNYPLTVALKRLRVHVYEDKGHVQKLFRREAAIWSQLKHPNILPFVAVYVNLHTELSIASTWMANGDIVSYILSHPFANVQRLATNIVDGLAYMHCLGVVHGDLKSSNVLINEHHVACLSDFGLSTIHHTSTMTPRFDSIMSGGSARWCAPEQVLSGDTKPNTAVDVYAFGILLWELLTCQVPYDHLLNDVLVVRNVIKGLRPCSSCVVEVPGLIAGPVKGSLYGVMNDCWSSDVSSRPKIKDLRSRLMEYTVDGQLVRDTILPDKYRVPLLACGYGRRIYVAKLPDSITEQRIRDVFKSAGDIKDVSLHTIEGQPVHAVVEFVTIEGGEAALRMHASDWRHEMFRIRQCPVINWGKIARIALKFRAMSTV